MTFRQRDPFVAGVSVAAPVSRLWLEKLGRTP